MKISRAQATAASAPVAKVEPRVVSEKAALESFDPTPATVQTNEVQLPPQREVWGAARVVSKADQSRTLTAVLDEVSRVAASGKTPLVQVDLDLTSLLPVERTKAALQKVAEQFGVAELSEVAVLPGYTTQAFKAFLDESGLQQKYPAMEWGTFGAERAGETFSTTSLYAVFREAYWNAAPVESDVVADGFADFVSAVRSRGGEVVFNSGRAETMRAATLAALQNGGIENATLLIGTEPGKDGGQMKAQRQAELEAMGTTVAIIDDRERNRSDVAKQTPGAMQVAVAAKGFTAEPKSFDAQWKIASFER